MMFASASVDCVNSSLSILCKSGLQSMNRTGNNRNIAALITLLIASKNCPLFIYFFPFILHNCIKRKTKSLINGSASPFNLHLLLFSVPYRRKKNEWA